MSPKTETNTDNALYPGKSRQISFFFFLSVPIKYSAEWHLHQLVGPASSGVWGASCTREMVNGFMHPKSLVLGGNSSAGALTGLLMAEKTGLAGRELAGGGTRLPHPAFLHLCHMSGKAT